MDFLQFSLSRLNRVMWFEFLQDHFSAVCTKKRRPKKFIKGLNWPKPNHFRQSRLFLGQKQSKNKPPVMQPLKLQYNTGCASKNRVFSTDQNWPPFKVNGDVKGHALRFYASATPLVLPRTSGNTFRIILRFIESTRGVFRCSCRCGTKILLRGRVPCVWWLKWPQGLSNDQRISCF